MQETYKIEKRDWAAKLMAIVVVVTMVTSTFVLFAPEATARTGTGSFGYVFKDSAEDDGPTYAWTDIVALREAGATEVHMRISSPPVTHPCFYGIDTDTQDQLIAARLTLKEIEEQLKVDSLAYLSKQGMVDAARAESGDFCTACFDGNYPIEMDRELLASKLMLEPAGIAGQ